MDGGLDAVTCARSRQGGGQGDLVRTGNRRRNVGEIRFRTEVDHQVGGRIAILTNADEQIARAIVKHLSESARCQSGRRSDRNNKILVFHFLEFLQESDQQNVDKPSGSLTVDPARPQRYAKPFWATSIFRPN